MDFKELNLTQMDKNLTEKEREEWQAIYASYRGGSVLSGKAMGIEEHEISVVPEGKKRAVKESIRCLIVINYRVKVIIPETEVFNDGADMGQHVLQSMNGAELEYIITHIDREAGFAIGSRKQALTQIRRVNARRRLSENQIVDVKVISVGRGVCTVTYRGFDSVIAQRDISYTAVPDLREVIHPGDVKKAMVKEVNKAEGILKLSIRDTLPHPFDGIETRHPIGCTRIGTIVGKYAGGIFCRLYDASTDVLCSYATMEFDGDYKIGDSVEILIRKYNYERKTVYGKILRKMYR